MKHLAIRRGSKLRYTFLNSRIHTRGGFSRLCNGKTAIFEPRPRSLEIIKGWGIKENVDGLRDALSLPIEWVNS